MLTDEELRVRLEAANVAVEQLVVLELHVDRHVLLQVESAVEEASAVQTAVSVLGMELLAVLVQVQQVPAELGANVAGELEVGLVGVDDVVLEREVTFEAQVAVHAGVRDFAVPVVGLEVFLERPPRVHVQGALRALPCVP